ncbi:type II toxin-antitoxin system tRNA(fMet)-specific endonuclease VapC [Roseofilum casamattae]|uniref:Ribonuclease VapC n=1 Tax=Roseofilum casamattae BLCC-M143 TaxID=3022442 RepID=A0ABT7BSL7_9CYAN|nr:type II toxin-antitoxin system VapC family toxin [Roseofilum casamattae]MDJ1182190.1 type II toxin-antitoxin system VapC family toxin [Roseofilum casamattae BLCC-M143]
MKILLDTDICVYTINRRDPKLLERLQSYSVGEVGISAITYAELRFGVENSARREENSDRLERFLLPLEILPFDEAAGVCYGRLRTELKRAGSIVGNNDLLIASHALSLNLAIAANNLREFSRVPNLQVEQWI